MRSGMSAWLCHHFLWMLVYQKGENQWTWRKTSQTHIMALTLPDLNLGHAVGRQVFSPLDHPLLSSVPHQILACLCSPEILMQAISEKNHVPPTNTPNPSPPAPAPVPVTDYDFFFIWQCAECCRFKHYITCKSRLKFLSLGRFLISFVS